MPAVTGAAAADAPSGTSASLPRMIGARVTGMSMTAVPATVGVKISRPLVRNLERGRRHLPASENFARAQVGADTAAGAGAVVHGEGAGKTAGFARRAVTVLSYPPVVSTRVFRFASSSVSRDMSLVAGGAAPAASPRRPRPCAACRARPAASAQGNDGISEAPSSRVPTTGERTRVAVGPGTLDERMRGGSVPGMQLVRWTSYRTGQVRAYEKAEDVVRSAPRPAPHDDELPATERLSLGVNELPSVALTTRFLALCQEYGSEQLAVSIVAAGRSTGVSGLPQSKDWTAVRGVCGRSGCRQHGGGVGRSVFLRLCRAAGGAGRMPFAWRRCRVRGADLGLQRPGGRGGAEPGPGRAASDTAGAGSRGFRARRSGWAVRGRGRRYGSGSRRAAFGRPAI